MSNQRKLDRIILDLEDIRDSTLWIDEQQELDEALNKLRSIHLLEELR